MVFAIDETCLSNYADMVHLDFGGTYEEMNSLKAEGHDPAITSALALYNYAKNHGVSIFFITARPEYERSETIENLEMVGFSGWTKLFMEPDNYNNPSIIPFKVSERKKIIALGYDIILNVGSQQSDLDEGYSDMAFKLPNPFYQVG